MLLSSRDTCICEMPISAPISRWGASHTADRFQARGLRQRNDDRELLDLPRFALLREQYTPGDCGKRNDQRVQKRGDGDRTFRR